MKPLPTVLTGIRDMIRVSWRELMTPKPQPPRPPIKVERQRVIECCPKCGVTWTPHFPFGDVIPYVRPGYTRRYVNDAQGECLLWKCITCGYSERRPCQGEPKEPRHLVGPDPPGLPGGGEGAGLDGRIGNESAGL